MLRKLLARLRPGSEGRHEAFPPGLSVIPFSQEQPRLFSDKVCDGVIIRHPESFAHLRAMLHEQQLSRAEEQAFLLFDDVYQASYTSGHVAEALDLASLEGRDLSAYDPSLIDNDFPQAACPELFPERLENFRRYLESEGSSFPERTLMWSDPDQADDLIFANDNPDQALLIASEREFVVQFAPVAKAAEILAAFPNGYFHGDLTPAQNFALSEVLAQENGLHLRGIGSRFLLFCSAAALPQQAARRAVRTVLALYDEVPIEAEEALTALLTDRDWLLVRYSE